MHFEFVWMKIKMDTFSMIVQIVIAIKTETKLNEITTKKKKKTIENYKQKFVRMQNRISNLMGNKKLSLKSI